MELSEVRCSSASEELYAVNKTPSGGGSTRPKRLLWQSAVRHITEQRFIHEQQGGGNNKRSPGHEDDDEDPRRHAEPCARKQSAGRTTSSFGDRDRDPRQQQQHNGGGGGTTKVFPERAASSDLGFLQLDRAPSNSDFFLSWGHARRGVICPTLRNAFKSRELERLYQRYFLGQRRKSVVVTNLLHVVTKLTLLLLHATLAAAPPVEPLRGALLGVFTGAEVLLCALVAAAAAAGAASSRGSSSGGSASSSAAAAASHGYLQYSGAVTWAVMAAQVLAAALGRSTRSTRTR